LEVAYSDRSFGKILFRKKVQKGGNMWNKVERGGTIRLTFHLPAGNKWKQVETGGKRAINSQKCTLGPCLTGNNTIPASAGGRCSQVMILVDHAGDIES
jgi:hypothetical protein